MLKEKLPGLSAKELTRLAAIQVIYSVITNSDVDSRLIVKDFLENNSWELTFEGIEEKIFIPNIDIRLFNSVTSGYLDHKDELKDILIDNLNNNVFFEQDLLLKIILFLGIYEIKFTDTPVAVIVSQYEFMSSLFLEDKQVYFINSLLNKIASKIRVENA